MLIEAHKMGGECLNTGCVPSKALLAAANAAEAIRQSAKLGVNLAISQRLRIKAMAQIIAPYPTLGDVKQRVAGSFYAPSLFSPRMRKLVRLLQMLG